MLHPLKRDFLKSVDQLFESEVNIHNNSILFGYYKNNLKFLNAMKEGRVKAFVPVGRFSKEIERLKRENIAFVQSCEYFKNTIERRGDGRSWEGLYQISEPAFVIPKNLYVAPRHPNLSQFQKFMDFCFQAGLLKFWEENFYHVLNEGVFPQHEEEKTILDIHSIEPFLLILAFGFVAGFLTLLLEIFYHDFWSQILKAKFFNFFRTRQYRRTRNFRF